MLSTSTLFVTLFAAFALFGVTLAVARRSLPQSPEVAQWSRGIWLVVAGFVLLVSRALTAVVSLLFALSSAWRTNGILDFPPQDFRRRIAAETVCRAFQYAAQGSCLSNDKYSRAVEIVH